MGSITSRVVEGYVVLSRDHELAGPERFGDRPRRAFHVLQIRVAAVGQRRGHADQQHVRLAQPGHVGRGFQLLFLDPIGHRGGVDVLDVTAAGGEGVHLRLVHVKPHAVKPGLRESLNQRQSHITQPDYPDHGGLVRNRFRQILPHDVFPETVRYVKSTIFNAKAQRTQRLAKKDIRIGRSETLGQ